MPTSGVATFDELPKGTYVFEYNLRANNSGNFSNGITSIKACMHQNLLITQKESGYR